MSLLLHQQSSAFTTQPQVAQTHIAPPPDPGISSHAATPEVLAEEDISGSNRTQNSQLLDDFESMFEELGNLILESEADSHIGTSCICGNDRITTQCHDCMGYEATCSACFIEYHRRSPFHWTEVWDFARGFFVRNDISSLGHVIQLGHGGKSCPNPTGERIFTVVNGNGVHSTRLAFCGCQEQPPNKIKQLMRSRLFPATTKEPRTAFAFSVLKEFSLHNLESKKAAYDYLGALLRLTDNAFIADVPIGFFHKDLRGIYLFGALLAPNLVSTVIRIVLRLHIIFVVNKQDKKKFKNMAITGTVNCQCSHVFVLSCVDLQYGEKFGKTDYGLAMAIRQRKPGEQFEVILKIEVDDIDHVATYNIACEYFINLESRFLQHFPDLVNDVARIRWGVPALHIQGHQESCHYLFGTAYMECVCQLDGRTKYFANIILLAPRPQAPKLLTPEEQQKLADQRPDGWLWTDVGRLGKLSESEMEEWSSEGDRVMWFRAEAEMQRWQEQHEQKLVELLRTSRSFGKMQSTWSELGDSHALTSPGHAAYARQKTAMYERRREEAQQFIIAAGYESLLLPTAKVINYILEERRKEAEYVSSLIDMRS
ncbi:hypothetical protein C8J57DRAFT_1247744 [Mycena rebaudengoi]|nr:hypothetical protein C8J57DRAFT_1247744 [Mycena rebaudengoi]